MSEVANEAVPLYQLKHVRKEYVQSGASLLSGDEAPRLSTTALDDISLEIAEGEFVCLLGRSGEGKSTLLHLLGGLDRPTGGELIYRGTDLSTWNLNEYRRTEVGFVFQMFHLLPGRSALDNVALGLRFSGQTSGDCREASVKWLSRLGLAGRLSHQPHTLSGGERQRVAIARAMVKRPNVLLADEPTGNLDRRSRADVLDAIQAMNQEHGVTVVMVTHNQQDAMQYADRIVHLVDRRVDWTGPACEFSAGELVS